MSTRKKWKLRLITAGGATEVRATSEPDAYRKAWAELDSAIDGHSRVTAVTILFDEGRGGWSTFEQLTVADAVESRKSRTATS